MAEKPPRDNAAIGARIAQFRAHLGLSQEAFANRVGGKKRGLQGNEGGVALPNSKFLLGMVDLGVNLNWLLTGHGAMLAEDERAMAPITDDDLGRAIAVISKAFTTGAQKSPQTADEAELLTAYRAASLERRQILLEVARTPKAHKTTRKV